MLMTAVTPLRELVGDPTSVRQEGSGRLNKHVSSLSGCAEPVHALIYGRLRDFVVAGQLLDLLE